MEFEIGGHTYRANRMDARSQFHITRRLAPVFGELAPAMKGGAMDAIAPLANAIAKLSDADADYILFGLLRSVSRKQPQGLGWAPVAVGDVIMFDDITMPQMIQIAWRALAYNLQDFFAGLPSGSSAGRQKQSEASNG